jgi:hypothetical protein
LKKRFAVNRICLALSVTIVTLFGIPHSEVYADSIGREEFMNDKTITELKIDGDVTSIGDRAYYGCTNLESVEIGEGVRKIGESAFAMCPNLKYVTIPYSMKTIMPGAFAGDTSLSALTFPNGNVNFYFLAGALYNSKGTRLIAYMPGKSYSIYDMPDSIKYVDNYAFWGSKNLQKVYVSPNVETITPYDFAYCSGLKYIYLPSSVKMIEEYAFRDCKNLQYIYTEGKKVKVDPTALTNAAKVKTISGADLDTFNSKFVLDDEEEVLEMIRAEAAVHQDDNKTPTAVKTDSDGNVIATASGNAPAGYTEEEWARLVAKNSHFTSNDYDSRVKVTDSVDNKSTSNTSTSSTSQNTASGNTSSSSSSASSNSSSSRSDSSTSTSSSSSSGTSGTSSGSSTSTSSTSSSTASGNSVSSASVSSNSSTGTGGSVGGHTTIINRNYYSGSGRDYSKELAEYRRNLVARLAGPYRGNTSTSPKVTINLPADY